MMRTPTAKEISESYCEEDGVFTSVSRTSRDDWRHGSTIVQIFRREDGTYWQTVYRRSGNGEYDGLRDEEGVEICQVEPYTETVTVTKYRAVKS